MDKLTEDIGEVRHQIVSMNDYTGELRCVQFNSLSKEAYESMVKEHAPYNLDDSDYDLEENK